MDNSLGIKTILALHESKWKETIFNFSSKLLDIWPLHNIASLSAVSKKYKPDND